MSTITTRSGKGSPLTNNEVDANFTNLNTDKLESGDLSVVTTAVGTAALAYNSGVFTYTPPDLTAIDLSLYAPLAGAVFTGTVEAPLFKGDLSGAQLFPAKAGEALTKGDALYISGISGNNPVVMKADANDPAKMPSFGLAGATVNNNASVNCVTYGQIHNLDTTAFSLGDQLYVSTTPGALTPTAPTGETSQIQNLGKVERVHQSVGALFVAGSGRANATPNLNDGNFFLGNASNQSVSTDFTTAVLGEISAGTGIGLSGGVISNTAPDQTVALTGAGATSISGTYPNFTITSTDTNTVYTLPFADNSTNWNTAYGWGNHASAGYLTSVLTPVNGSWWNSGFVRVGNDGVMEVGKYLDFHTSNTGGNVDYDLRVTASPGALAVAGTISVTGGNSTNWNTAYGWGNHASQSYATQSYVGTAISNLVDSSPATLDTLNELAAALGDDPNFATTVSTSIGTKWTQDNTKISQWNTAYGWGNHASAGYTSNVGDITGVTAGTGLTGGGTSGTPILNVIGGDGITANADNITVDSTVFRNNSAQSLQFNTTTGEALTFKNSTSGGLIQVGFQQNDTDGMHHRAYLKAWKGSTTASGNVDLIVRGSSGSTTSDVLSLRSGNASPTWRGQTIWNAGNDGSGSGLDADLLDGQQGSYYAPASHNHSGVYTPYDHFSHTGQGNYTSTTTAALLAEALGYNAFDSKLTAHKTSWSYAGNGDLTDAGRLTELAGTSWLWWTDNSADNVQGYITGLCIAPNSGGSAGKMFVYNNQSNGGWREIWTSTSDGSGSGLDADLLDGQQGSYYASASSLGNYLPRSGGTMTGTLDLGTQNINVDTNKGFVNSGSWTRNQTPYGYIDFGPANAGTAHIYTDRASFYFNKELLVNGGTVWHAGNGGSGSGLDADLLDGQQGSYYAANSSLNSYMPIRMTTPFAVIPTGGWAGYNLGNGTMLQGGSTGLPSGGTHGYWHVNGRRDSGGGYVGLYFQDYNASSGMWIGKSLTSADPTWERVWSAGTGGSGSGLDADLLDGQEGSYYAPASHVHSYLPLTGGTLTGNVSATRFRSTNGTIAPLSSSYTFSNVFTSEDSSTRVAYFDGNGGNASVWWGNGANAHAALDSSDGLLNVWVNPSNGSWYNIADFSTSGLAITTGGLRVNGIAQSVVAQHDASSGWSAQIVSKNATTNVASFLGSWNGYAGVFAHTAALNAWAPIYINAHSGSGQANVYTGPLYVNGSNLAWHAGNGGSGSGLDADLLDGQNSDNFLGKFGNSYYQANTWVQHTGEHGLYAPTINDAHFYPNGAGSYGTWRINGSRGGYTGIYLNNGGGVVMGMYDAGGNGGEWANAAAGGWHHYYHRGNRCMGVAGSSTSGSYGLYEQGGGIYSTGNITAYSDRRVKENIRTIDNALETVEQMRGVYYNRIDDEEKKTVIGFIAQEVDEVEGAKPLVTYAEDVDQYGVSYGNTAALLVEAIKDLSQQVKDLQSEIKEMKNA